MPRPGKAPRDAGPESLPYVSALHSAIADDGRSPYALALASDVDEAAVRRFISRERSLSLDSAARLAAALGLQVVRKARPKKAPRGDAA